MHISNIVMEVFAMDTAIHRLRKNDSDPHTDVAHTFINDAMSRVEFSAKQVLAAISEGERSAHTTADAPETAALGRPSIRSRHASGSQTS